MGLVKDGPAADSEATCVVLVCTVSDSVYGKNQKSGLERNCAAH